MPERRKKQREEALLDGQVLEEMQRMVEKGRPPYFDNVHGHQGLAELDKVRDWAEEMEKCGHPISGIRLNLDESGKPDDPPDVLAEIDGRPIGIEVTDLVEYPKQHTFCIVAAGRVTSLRWKRRQNGRIDFHWHGADLGPDEKAKWERRVKAGPDWRYREPGVEWPLERFQMRLAEIVETKDEKAGAKKAKRMRMHGEDALDLRLHRSFLLIFTPEFYLQDHLDEYVEKTEVRCPENFDRVFLMGDYVPGERSRRRPVFEIRLIACRS